MLAAKAQENTFFPSVLTEEAKWLSSQRRARASGWALCRMSLEWTGGAREGAVGGLAAADWAGQLSVPQEEVHFSTPPPHLQLKVKNLQTLEVALLASEGCVGVRVWCLALKKEPRAGPRVRTPGFQPTTATKQLLSCLCDRTRRLDQLPSQAQDLPDWPSQPGGGPSPSADHPAAPGLGLEAENLRLSDSSPIL